MKRHPILVDETQYSNVLTHCLEVLNIKKDEKFGYMEFGSYIGTSLLIANKTFQEYNPFYVCFDSFKGLPYVKKELYQPFFEGQFYCTQDEFNSNLLNHNFPVEKLKVYSGFFNQSFKTVDEQNKFKIFMVDCDIYSSTKECLNFLVDYFEDECIIIFDDWFAMQIHFEKGQKKAFDEFKEKNKNLSINLLGYYKYHNMVCGKYFKVKKNK